MVSNKWRESLWFENLRFVTDNLRSGERSCLWCHALRRTSARSIDSDIIATIMNHWGSIMDIRNEEKSFPWAHVLTDREIWSTCTVHVQRHREANAEYHQTCQRRHKERTQKNLDAFVLCVYGMDAHQLYDCIEFVKTIVDLSTIITSKGAKRTEWR